MFTFKVIVQTMLRENALREYETLMFIFEVVFVIRVYPSEFNFNASDNELTSV